MNFSFVRIPRGSFKNLGIRRLISDSSFEIGSKENPRINQVGIQYLSEQLQQRVFPKSNVNDYITRVDSKKAEISKEHLSSHKLLGKKTQISEPIRIEGIPRLIGENTLDEHFFKLGSAYSEPYLSLAKGFLGDGAKLAPRPNTSEWQLTAGWTKYVMGKEPSAVAFPEEECAVFDVEVMYKLSKYPVLAVCATANAWYGWVSPALVQYKEEGSVSNWEHLIPFDTLNNPKLIVGYNVSYDRARIKEEYNIQQSKAFFLDGMALHVAVSGICSQQRPKWQKYKKIKSQINNEHQDDFKSSSAEENFSKFEKEYFESEAASELIDDPWLNKGAPNSLASVADLHCNIKLNKSDRDYFSSTDLSGVSENFNNLMDYCASDVSATYEVTAKLLPTFLSKNPHPVSFAALKHLGTLVLPTSTRWNKYLDAADKIYSLNRANVNKILTDCAKQYIKYIDNSDDSLKPEWEKDHHLSQLNWDIKQVRLKKNGEPAASQAFLTGYPEWYRELYKTETVDNKKEKVINLTVRTRITPLILKLKWENYPLFWTDSNGWCFKVPYDENVIEDLTSRNYLVAKLSEDEQAELSHVLRDGINIYELFKVPHPDGPSKRCTSVMSKNFIRYFEDGTITSEFPFVQEILKLNNIASYWMGNRQRIRDQFVVFPNKNLSQAKALSAENKEPSEKEEMGIILPILCTMGTITRRATENTWLTASNTKKNRIGSELKAMVQAPPGYCIVGADVDSEELWIAALIGDSTLGFHGSTALGWMTLEGDKMEKTDLHSKTADILGISRNDAKVFNYGRIYGAGATFATRLLKQCNTKLSDQEAVELTKKLYANTKGETMNSKYLDKKVYYGGTESLMFNVLESIASTDNPRTPALGASITDALRKPNLNKNSFLTSRINWVIQSSGVDYLHLLIISMEYLTKLYAIDARLMITVHDEVRYLVKENQRYEAALLLQISNLWVRAIFCEQLGIKEVPQSCAFFSEVDIDHVLRKDVTLDCVTPSNPEPIPPGESYNMKQLLEKCDYGAFLERPKTESHNFNEINYIERRREIMNLDDNSSSATQLSKLKLQLSTNRSSWRTNMTQYIKAKEKNNHQTDVKVVKKRKVTKMGKKMAEEFDLVQNGEFELSKDISHPSLRPRNTKLVDSKGSLLKSFAKEDIARKKVIKTSASNSKFAEANWNRTKPTAAFNYNQKTTNSAVRYLSNHISPESKKGKENRNERFNSSLYGGKPARPLSSSSKRNRTSDTPATDTRSPRRWVKLL